jgi:hypothetical protein
MMLTFDHAAHRYALEGVIVPSVTQILKASGLIDFSGIPVGTLNAALERGTVVHEAIHFFNDGDLDLDQFREDFPAYVGYLEGWLSFCDQRHFVPVLNEHRVASPRHLVAGTLDSLGLLDGQAVLLDFATGRPSDVCKWLQTAAYELLAREWAAEDPALAAFFDAHGFVKRYAVALRKDGTFRLEGYTAPSDAREFLALLTAFRIVEKYRGERPTEAAA